MQGKGKAELSAFQIHTRKASIVNNQGDNLEKDFCLRALKSWIHQSLYSGLSRV